MGQHGQLSLFDADLAPADPTDLEGLLAGPGQVVRMGGTARVSVVVPDGWRARVLLDEFASRGVSGTATRDAAIEGHIGVRTAFSKCLAPLAARWITGALTRPPEGFGLDGPRLRLWFVAAGRVLGPAGRPSQGAVLGLSATDDGAWTAVGAALARIGLPAQLLSPRAGGPAYRVVGRRRVARLAELIGTPPAGVPCDAWPRTVSATEPTGTATAGR